MSPEKMGGIRPIWEKIKQEVADVAPTVNRELKGSSETRAEELFALWQDYRRIKQDVNQFKQRERGKAKADLTYKEQGLSDPITIKKVNDLKEAIAERWNDDDTQKTFKKNLESSIDERVKTRAGVSNYEELETELDADKASRELIYRDVFKNRAEDPDELTQINIAELSAKIKDEEASLRLLEKENFDLGAHLSFKRIKNYREQLAKYHFIWAPSREEYFQKITDHLVIVNQNRPLLLAGETGTGKTVLARAVSRRLTEKPPYEVGEEAKTDIRPLLGSRAIDPDGSYINYGQLGQALTGKQTSRDTKAGDGGIFYMDEMNGYPPDALRSLVKQISGRHADEEISFAAWAGQKEKLAPNFGFLGSANLPSEKHPDRADLPVEVARELPTLEIDYPPQTAENPELYEMMLAALMDKNNRIRLTKQELEPDYTDDVNAPENEKQPVLNIDPQSGGTLWRFANLVADIQKSYKGQENTLTADHANASYLRMAVLDPGLVLSWLAAYRKSASRANINLETFLAEKLEGWSEQKTYPEEDRNLVKKFVAKFNIVANDTKYADIILTPLEIGALSPRVSRQIQTMTEAPKPLESSVYLPTGEEVLYNPMTKQPASGSSMTRKNDRSGEVWTFKGYGLGDNKDKAVLENQNSREIVVVERKKFEKEWMKQPLVFSEKFNNKENKIDVLKILKSSADFYQSHNLPEYLKGLPKDIKFSRDGETRIREALRMGFDSAMILPAADIQSKSVENLSQEMANKELAGLSAADQYSAPYFESDTKTSQSLNRPAKAYLLLYQSGPIPQETKGQSPDVLRPLFKSKKWDGLTLPEYLVLQRQEAEIRKDHSFDAYNNGAAQSNWMWLLDTKVSPSRVVSACWAPGDHRVNVSWRASDLSHPALGARPVVVIEIL